MTTPSTSAATSTHPLATRASPGIPITLDAPSQVEAGKEFLVSWTGPVTYGDYITIVAKGATEYTDEPYFNTNIGNPAKLLAPATPGDYELWYLLGDTADAIMARRPITVK